MAITQDNKSVKPQETILLKKNIVIPSNFTDPYMDVFFIIPKNAAKVGVRSSHARVESFPWIYISIFDPITFRGSQLRYLREGVVKYDLWVTQTDASFGCIPGTIPDGEWRVQLDITQLRGPEDVFIEVYYETNPQTGRQLSPFFDERVINKKPGWFKGELHSHTRESDGVLTVNELIDNANSSGLDFFAITDHFTISQWWKVDQSNLPDMVLLNSSEITSQSGHANVHGIKEWVDVYIDRDDWDPNSAADQAHQQGGLFCINHVMSSLLAWRHYDFDWENADLMEIFHSLEGPNNMPQISFWDALLREGHRIIGVAGTDCHNPENKIEKLGKVVTWVHAEELSQRGIIDGLKKGNVYVSHGPKMDFSVSNTSGEIAGMGASIQSDKRPLKLTISVESNNALRATVIKNGMFFNAKSIESGKGETQIIEFIDAKPMPGYYRVELHEILANPAYRGIEWRDFTTIQVISNPVWVN
jgi:hypothetical protein